MRTLWVVSTLLVPLVALAQPAPPGQELVKNGSFEAADKSGTKPADWGWGGGRWAEGNGNHWVVQESDSPARSLSVSQNVPLAESCWKLRVSCRVRVTNVVQGAEGWHDARIAMQFQDAAGKQVGAWPNVLHWTGSTEGWVAAERDYVVPDGAARLNMSCSLFSTTGTVEWDDISVKLLKTDPVLEDATLPAGVTAEWGLQQAWQQETPTRAKVCLNGLWRFHPVDLQAQELPAAGTGWGYLKVPGSWMPANSSQTAFGPDIWEGKLDLAKADAAWYERRVTVPASWTGRRILVNLDNPKQTARVLLDGRLAGEVVWPGGTVDVTALARPGSEQTLSVYLLALPLEQEQLRIAREDFIEKVRADTRFRGLCGDCYLEAEPVGARVTDVFLKPSTRRGGLGVSCGLAGLDPARRYRLRAALADGGKTVKQFDSAEFAGGDKQDFFGKWADPKLWDLDQPNLYEASLELRDSSGKLLDRTTPVQFGFREFWIQGRDFYLNGSRIHLRCLDYSNAGGPLGLTSLAAAKETFAHARALGFNYVIHSHYDYEAQSFHYLADTLRAGDQVGFPMSYSIRHVARIYREFTDPAKRADWNRIVDYEVRQVRNHPCVFMWAMNHNFTGWADDQNPALLAGKFQPSEQDNPELYRRRYAATLSEQYVMGLDGTRPCYHHQSGTLNQLTTLNCYLCFTPLQDRIEWLSRYAGEGVKPLFFVEFGLPHQASWGGHRTGPFIWRNAVSPEPLVQEFGAMYYGDAAYDLPDYADKHYDTIEKVYALGQPFGIGSVLGAYWGNRWEKNFLELKTLHTAQTWPAFRTWGISALLPWDQADLFKSAPGAQFDAVTYRTSWSSLQRPGVAPDSRPGSSDWLTTTDRKQLRATSLGEVFGRVNREVLAYLAGPARRFTARDHLFAGGETVEKQVALINDLRRPAQFGYQWTATVPGQKPQRGSGKVRIAAGDKALVPFRFTVPKVSADTTGRLTLLATVDGKPSDCLIDSFDFTVLAPTPLPALADGVAVYDPRGLTTKLLTAAGLRFTPVTTLTPPPGCRLLVIGREALGGEGSGVDLAALTAAGTNVLCFEQTEDFLQRRLGFRTASPGVRRVYVRQPGHPVCRGLSDELLRDWRGSASLVPPYPHTATFRNSYPSQVWCGFDNTRTWKWGNYGCVATVVVEKPQRGNFSSLLDCEFDQQYTPLLEWRGRGKVLLSQIDLSGRDLPEPAAARLLANLLAYAQQGTQEVPGPCRYVGGAEMGDLLAKLGVQQGGSEVAVLAPGADPEQAKAALAAARTVICLGLDGQTLSGLLPFAVQTEERAATHTLVGRPTSGALVGLGNSELHWRARRTYPALTAAGQLKLAPGGLAAEGTVGEKRYVLFQPLPAMFNWQEAPQLKRTWRHSLTALATVLSNCGVAMASPLAQRLPLPAPLALDLSGPWQFTTDPQQKLNGEAVSAAGFAAPGWRQVTAPGMWEGQGEGLASYDGYAWYRKEFDLAQVPSVEGLKLRLGAVDDEDWTYLNGRLVGHIGQDTNPQDYWSAERSYAVPAGLLRAGGNVVVVKVNDLRQGGGFGRGPLGLYEPGRWLGSFYLDEPMALDDPYRYNRW